MMRAMAKKRAPAGERVKLRYDLKDLVAKGVLTPEELEAREKGLEAFMATAPPGNDKLKPSPIIERALKRMLGLPAPEQPPPTPGLNEKPRRRGPPKGTVSRYAADDRKFFPRMRKMIEKGESVQAAALACADKLKGGNTALASKATRLAKLYRAENPSEPSKN
jgi:hypothetical protein